MGNVADSTSARTFFALFEGRGVLEGMREGKREGAAALLERQLSLRFGPLPDTVRSRLARASDAQLVQWGEAILEADSLRQVFARRH